MNPADIVREISDAHARSVFRDHEWVVIAPTGTGTYTLSGLGLTNSPLEGDTEAAVMADADAHLADLSTMRTTRWIAHGDEAVRALVVVPTS
ncbi:hypothetical protein ACF07Q_28550 [Nocardiopsis dassonvillei]|uniref:hypothetical protein n=1 Tax=Nocardiopsis dassonvillei TaxID=2014 RepID=UPI0036FCC599